MTESNEVLYVCRAIPPVSPVELSARMANVLTLEGQIQVLINAGYRLVGHTNKLGGNAGLYDLEGDWIPEGQQIGDLVLRGPAQVMLRIPRFKLQRNSAFLAGNQLNERQVKLCE